MPDKFKLIVDEGVRTVEAALISLGIQIPVDVKVIPYMPIEIQVDAEKLLKVIADVVAAQAGRHGDAIDGFVNITVRGETTVHRQTIVTKRRWN